MKLEIGVPDYHFEHDIEKAALRGRIKGRDLILTLLSMKDMRWQHKILPQLRGLPLYVAFDPEEKKVWFHPTPDAEYHADIVPREETARPWPSPSQEKSRFAGTITKAMLGRK